VTDPGSNLQRARAALDRNPRLRAVFDELFAWLADATTAVAVGGSVERGEVDRYSDLDLLVVTRDAAASGARRAAVRDRLRQRYVVVALFDAAHLGLDCLDSVFVLADGRIVKVDIAYWASELGAAPVGGLLVHDPAGLGVARPAGVDEVWRAPVDLPGWTCHVRKIVGRGELFESAHCLDEMRRRFLVPVLLELNGAAQVNYRRIEQRLPAVTLDRLRRTYPAVLTAEALGAALDALVAGFTEAYAQLPEARRAVTTRDLARSLTIALSTPVG
jgi:predicted nucleotidyltransferase